MVSSFLSKQWLMGLRCGQEGQSMGTRDEGKSTSLMKALKTIFPCSMEGRD